VAAHVEGKGAIVLDMSGLAQKGGPVMSHVRLADNQADLHSTRVGTGSADLVIGCDLIVTASRDALSRMGEGRTHADDQFDRFDDRAFVKNPDWQFPDEGSRGEILRACGNDNVDFVDAGQIATALMGDSIATNMFMLGYAFQKGHVPLRKPSIMKAIELNGVSVAFNKAAFNWGRTAAHDLAVGHQADHAGQGDRVQAHPDAGRCGQRRIELLTAYQNAAYAKQYKSFVDQVRAEEEAGQGHPPDRSRGALLLQADGLQGRVRSRAPVHRSGASGRRSPACSKATSSSSSTWRRRCWPSTTRRATLIKQEFGPWMMKAFGVLAKFKGLRGTALDVFGYTAERKMERALIGEYRETVSSRCCRS
jgi:indolepyruvate ferredoxin oxidoreductase